MTDSLIRKVPSLNVVGSGYVGWIQVSFEQLVAAFGWPNARFSTDGRVRAEWILAWDAGRDSAFTIYDYKSPVARVFDVVRWHIGGDHRALTVLADELNLPDSQWYLDRRFSHPWEFEKGGK